VVEAFREGAPAQVRLDAQLLLGPTSDFWKATDPEGGLWGVRFLPEREVDQIAWRDVRRISSLDNPYIARIVGRVQVDGVSGLVRQWVTGRPVDRFWRPNQPLTDVEQYFRAALSAVKTAHRHGVVHGGLKPSRIYIDESEKSLHVLDFAMGPWLPPRAEDAPWLAPERRESFDADIRGDVYALGALLYWLATNTVPANPPVPVQQLRPDLPRGVLRAIEGAMHPDREARYASCNLIEDDVGPIPENTRMVFRFPSIELQASEVDLPEDETFEDLVSFGPHSRAKTNTLDPATGNPTLPPPSTTRLPTPAAPVHGLRALPKPPQPATEAVAPPPPESPLKSQRVQILVGVGLLLIGLVSGWFWHLSTIDPRTLRNDPPKAPMLFPDTRPTSLAFGGSSQPDVVQVDCPVEGVNGKGRYRGTAPVVGGLAMIGNIPDVEGCSLSVSGVPVEGAVPIAPYQHYQCEVDKGRLRCARSSQH
jgi:serine/threonine protein kinase